MTTISGILKTNALDTISSSLIIGNDATTVNMGNVNVNNITNVQKLQQKPYYISTQNTTFTVNDFLTNGVYIVSTYSSANPSSINDVITVNLPTPTASLEGVNFFFRKLRGSISTGTTNWTFNTSPASIIFSTSSLTTTGQPISTLSFNQQIQRAYVLGYNGSYYWTFA